MKTLNNASKGVLRVLDANINRLREAIRVIEEYFRFVDEQSDLTRELKIIRHSLENFENTIGRENLLRARNTKSDVFAKDVQSEELNRFAEDDILTANFKRAQEATRVLEEYLKLTEYSSLISIAKNVRFAMYNVEKKIIGD